MKFFVKSGFARRFYRRSAAAALVLPLVLAASLPPAFPASSTTPVPPAALAPAPTAPLIGQIVARFLEEDHYDHHPIDAATSQNFLRNYIEAFDYNHIFFLQSDVDSLRARYGDTLGDLLKNGDLSPAFSIFNLFMKRLKDRNSYAIRALSSTFDFNKNESITLDRHKLPWPASRQDSDRLWRRRVKYELLEERLNKVKPPDQIKEVRERYERLLKSYQEFDSSDVLQEYLSALTHAYDPHSDYMAQEQKENFDISMQLSLVGIGAVLREQDGYASIVSLVPGGPADKDKRLKPKDRIEAVAQGANGAWVGTVGMRLDRVVEMIRGKKGTIVRLRVIPASAMDPSTRIVITLTRDKIKLTDQEARASVIEGKGADGLPIKAGVIDLPSFYEDMKSGGAGKSTSRDVLRLLDALEKKNIQGLILDLRRNGGGSLSEAILMTGLFVPPGPVVQVKDAHEVVRALYHSNSMAYSGPMVVLTSRASASASEIFAAALQDYDRALIVGDQSTFGKGTVQTLIDLSPYVPSMNPKSGPGALKLTIQKFYRVSGGSTQNKGVIPDIQLPSIEDYMDIAESALDNALPYDEVDPAYYQKLDDLSPGLIDELHKASALRVDTSREFGYVKEDIALFKKKGEGKTASLNEKTRLEQRHESEMIDQERKKERLAAGPDRFLSKEITLESLDQAGGPAPNPGNSAKSSKTGGAIAVSSSTASGAGRSNPQEAPSAPDIVLEEGVDLLDDMIHPTLIPRELSRLSDQTKAEALAASRKRRESAADLEEILP